MSTAAAEERWLHEAIDLAEESVGCGGIPFAALVVVDGRVAGRGVNRVRLDCDVTAHAEIVAMRDAGRELHNPWLAGATLVASAEPCVLCLLAAAAARVDQVIFAADAGIAAAAGFDYAAWGARITPPETWPLLVRHVPVPNARRPFLAWAAAR